MWPCIETRHLLGAPWTCIHILGGRVRVVVWAVPLRRPESMTITLTSLKGTCPRLYRLKQTPMLIPVVLLHPPSRTELSSGPRALTTAAFVVIAPSMSVTQVRVFPRLFRLSRVARVATRPANLRARWCRLAQELSRVLVCRRLSRVWQWEPRCRIIRLPNTRMTVTRISIVMSTLKASSTATWAVGRRAFAITSITPSIIVILGKKDTISVRSGRRVYPRP